MFVPRLSVCGELLPKVAATTQRFPLRRQRAFCGQNFALGIRKHKCTSLRQAPLRYFLSFFSTPARSLIPKVVLASLKRFFRELSQGSTPTATANLITTYFRCCRDF